MDRNTPRAEAERWLGIAIKLLTARDFLGSKTFAVRARDSDPNNPLPDQILAVVETVLAGENRVNPSNHPDWYTVLQLPRLVRDPGLISDHYRRLTVLLSPESNRLPFADYSLQLVMDAWSVLSDPTKKWIFDNELSVYLQQHAPPPPPPQQPPVTAAENNQVNVFQFFQPAPPQQPPHQTVDVWQQQPEENQSYNQDYRQHSHQNSSNSNNNNQLHQIEFLQPPPTAAPELRMYQAAEEVQMRQVSAPQWQVRVPTPVRGGERREDVAVSKVVTPAQSTQRPTQPMFMRQETEVAEVLSPIRTTQRPTPQLPGQQMFMRRVAEVLSPTRTTQRPTPQLPAQPMFMRQEAEVVPVVEVSRRQATVPVPAAPLQQKPVAVPAKSVGMVSNIDVMMQPPPAVVPAKSVGFANNVDAMMQLKPAVVSAKPGTAARNIDVMMQPAPAVVPAKSETFARNIDVIMQPQPAVVTAKSVGLASKVDVMMQPAPATVVPAKSVNVARSMDVTMQPEPAVVPAKTVTEARNIDVMVQPPPMVTSAKSATSASNVDVMMQSRPVVIPSKSATLASNNDGNNSNSNSKSVGSVHENSNNNNNDNEFNDEDEDVDIDLSNNDGDTASADENNDGGVEEEGECFWTSCPYCLYVYEYPKKYQDRTLRCQNCRRCFHGLRIPTPPSMGGGGGGEKDKESSFRTWGCFPLGFSTAVWKNNNQTGKSSVASNWVPFTPMFAFPLQKGGGNFQWVSSNGGASIGPKNTGRPTVARPRSYVNIDDDGFVSDPSDSGSSDRDWRRNPALGKTIKKRKGNVGRPKKNSQDIDLRKTRIIVLGLTAGATEGARRRVVATRTINQTKRKVKKMGRLDLNVEFNNEGDERAPRVRAANGEEDGIENIGFFEGLDEFFSTLPILNVGEEEKAKPA